MHDLRWRARGYLLKDVSFDLLSRDPPAAHLRKPPEEANQPAAAKGALAGAQRPLALRAIAIGIAPQPRRYLRGPGPANEDTRSSANRQLSILVGRIRWR